MAKQNEDHFKRRKQSYHYKFFLTLWKYKEEMENKDGVVIVLQPVENNNKIVFNAPKYNLE
jgi:hypothetical protein